MKNEDKMNPIIRKPYTADELIHEIYEDNYSHLEFDENMGGEDCDCHIHITLNTMAKYLGIEVG